MWRLAIAERQRAVGVILFGACLIVLAATSRAERTDECRFEQTWYAGDVHFNEQIELRADSTGTWIENGAANDARRDRKDFTWVRTATTLAVTYDRDRSRTVDYRIERRRNACYLSFRVHPFLDDDSGFHQFADYP